MIPQQIKSLFEFINYLHSNIDNFGQYMEAIEEARVLNSERWKLNPDSSFQDRQRDEQIGIEIKKLTNIIDENIVQPMYTKARELNTFDPEHTETIWNRNYTEVTNLKERATKDDQNEILSYTRKYLAFRRSGKYTDYLFAGSLFIDLDKLIIKEIHNYFSGDNLTEGNPVVLQLTPQPVIQQKPEQETPKTFDELFYNTDLVTPCIDILKEIDPPLIDTDYNFIGKLKGIVCVWIDELQRQGIVKHYSDRKIFASLIPQKIKRFSIDESMFGKYQSKAEKNYRTDIKTMVSKIKLSHNSQNSH